MAADNELAEIRLATDLQVPGEVLTRTHKRLHGFQQPSEKKDSSNDMKVTDKFSAAEIKLVDGGMERRRPSPFSQLIYPGVQTIRHNPTRIQV